MVEITHEEIIKKLGFDPLNRGEKDPMVSGQEDDSKTSPYTALSDEELNFIREELLEAKKQGKLPAVFKGNPDEVLCHWARKSDDSDLISASLAYAQ